MKIKVNEEVLIFTDCWRDLTKLVGNEVKKINVNAEIILLPNPKVRKKHPFQIPSAVIRNDAKKGGKKNGMV